MLIDPPCQLLINKSLCWTDAGLQYSGLVLDWSQGHLVSILAQPNLRSSSGFHHKCLEISIVHSDDTEQQR